MKTLIVQYIPRGERSHTQKVLKAFESEVKGDVERLDLLVSQPDLFTADRLAAYIGRDYLGQEVDEGMKKQLAKMDAMIKQLEEADVVVLATPMHNFSLPALTKAWFDSVMLKGHTWDDGTDGYIGLLKGKKAIVINASGGIYEGEAAGLDHLQPLAQFEFRFLGFEDVRGVSAAGMNMPDVDKDAVVAKASERAAAIAKEWYA